MVGPAQTRIARTGGRETGPIVRVPQPASQKARAGDGGSCVGKELERGPSLGESSSSRAFGTHFILGTTGNGRRHIDRLREGCESISEGSSSTEIHNSETLPEDPIGQILGQRC